MLPDLCGFCQKTINSLEESIECIGPCEKHHLSCVKIDASERDFFIVEGHCRYKCHNCTRRDSDEVCVTPIPKCKSLKIRRPDSSFQPESLSTNLEHLMDILTALKDNSDCALVFINELAVDLKHLSKEIKLLRNEHSELKSYLLRIEKHSSMNKNNVSTITEPLQSSEKWIDTGAGEPSFSPQSNEDHCLKIVHKSVDVPNPNSVIDGDLTKQKILKIEARINSRMSTIHLKSEMSALPMNSLPPEVNSDKEILKKMTVTRSFPWKLGSFILLLAITALLFYDIQKHGTFRSSSTGLFLNDVGALQYAEHAWARTTFYSNKSFRWAEKNVPSYYKIMEEYVKPYLELTWDLCLVLGHQLQHIYVNIHAYIEEKTPLVIEWVNHYAPGLLEKVKQQSIDVWEIVKENGLLLWQYFLHYTYLALEWIKTNVFVGSLSPENLQKYSKDALNTTQVYVIWTYDWLCEKVQTLSKIQ